MTKKKKATKKKAKSFKISGDQIQRLVPSLGGAIASDAVMVDGAPVGSMAREEPLYEGDSGWAFTAGYESEADLDDPTKSGVYDLNTVANYDPDIIPFLTYPVGTTVFRPAPGEPLQVEVEPEEPPSVVFLTPLPAEEPATLDDGWILTPPAHMLRRWDDDSMIFWRPGFTVYLVRYVTSAEFSVADWLIEVRERASPERTGESVQEGAMTTVSYRLVERGEEQELTGLYGFACVEGSILSYVGYFDSEEDEAMARAFWSSLSHERVAEA